MKCKWRELRNLTFITPKSHEHIECVKNVNKNARHNEKKDFMIITPQQ